MGKASLWKKRYITPLKWMIEMQRSGMQQADLSLGIPSYSIFSCVPKKCLLNCQGALKAEVHTAFAARGCQLHQLQQRIMFHLAWWNNTYLQSCLLVLVLLKRQECSACHMGRVWALWPFMSPLCRSTFEENAGTSTKNGNYEVDLGRGITDLLL